MQTFSYFKKRNNDLSNNCGLLTQKSLKRKAFESLPPYWQRLKRVRFYSFLKKSQFNRIQVNSLVVPSSSSKIPFYFSNFKNYDQEKILMNMSSNLKYQTGYFKTTSKLFNKKKFSFLFSFIFEKNIDKFWNTTFDKGRLKNFISWFLKNYGERKTIELLEQFKKLGFGYATQGGISLGIDDLLIPPEKMNFLYSSHKMVSISNTKYKNAQITAVEKTQLFIDTWNETSENLKKEVVRYFEKTNIFNPVYMMAFSGARGNISQVRQLVGMRGLMSDPQGNIIDFPIQSNFREGLTLTEYIISTYGARKGIVDTALRTATAGYLTRRLVDVAQHVMISLFDCKTIRGIFVFDMKEGNQTLYSFQNRLIGRVLANDFKINKSIFLGFRNQEISMELAMQMNQFAKRAFIRSPLTCQSSKFVCQLCYGWSLSSNKLVSLGEAVGVIAAQSIGEPGTQLTMRTFHTGGVFAGGMTESVIANHNGWIEYLEPIPGTCVRTLQGKMAFLTKAESSFVLKKSSNSNSNILEKNNESKISKKNLGLEISFHKIPSYALLFVRHYESVFEKQMIAQFSSDRKQLKTQKGNAEQTVYADFEGEIFLNQIDLLEQKSNFFMQDTLWKSYDKSKIWILSGKIYQNAFLGSQKFLIQKKDFINKNSVFERISWYSSKSQLVEFIFPNSNKIKQSESSNFHIFHQGKKKFIQFYSGNFKTSVFSNFPKKKFTLKSRIPVGLRMYPSGTMPKTLRALYGNKQYFQTKPFRTSSFFSKYPSLNKNDSYGFSVLKYNNTLPTIFNKYSINKFYLKKIALIRSSKTSQFWVQRFGLTNKRYFILFSKDKWNSTKYLFCNFKKFSTPKVYKSFEIYKNFHKILKKVDKEKKKMIVYNQSKLKFQMKDFSILEFLSTRSKKKKWFYFLIKCKAIQNSKILKNSIYSRKILTLKMPYVYYYNNRFRAVFKQKYNFKDFSLLKFKNKFYYQTTVLKNTTKTSDQIFNYLNRLNIKKRKQKKMKTLTNLNNQKKFLPYFFKKNSYSFGINHFFKKPVYISKIFVKTEYTKYKEKLNISFQNSIFQPKQILYNKSVENFLKNFSSKTRNPLTHKKRNSKLQSSSKIIQFSLVLNNNKFFPKLNNEKLFYIYEKKVYSEKKLIIPISKFSHWKKNQLIFMSSIPNVLLDRKFNEKWNKSLLFSLNHRINKHTENIKKSKINTVGIKDFIFKDFLFKNKKKKFFSKKSVKQKFHRNKDQFSILDLTKNSTKKNFQFVLQKRTKRKIISNVFPDKKLLKTPVLSIAMNKILFNSMGYIFELKKFNSLKEKSKFINLHKHHLNSHFLNLQQSNKIKNINSKFHVSLNFNNKNHNNNKLIDFKTDKIFSFFPLNKFYLDINQYNEKNISRKFLKSKSIFNNENIKSNPLSLFNWFSFDFKINSGLFIWSKLNAKWNLQNDFWIQKKRFFNNSVQQKYLYSKLSVYGGQNYSKKIDFPFILDRDHHLIFLNKQKNYCFLTFSEQIQDFEYYQFQIQFSKKEVKKYSIIKENKIFKILKKLIKHTSSKNSFAKEKSNLSLFYLNKNSLTLRTKILLTKKLFNIYGSKNLRSIDESKTSFLNKTTLKFFKNFDTLKKYQFNNAKQKFFSNKRIIVTKKEMKILNQKKDFKNSKKLKSQLYSPTLSINQKVFYHKKFFERSFLIKKFSVFKQRFSWIEQENYKFLNIETNAKNWDNNNFQFYLVNRQGKKKYLTLNRSGLTNLSQSIFPYTKLKLKKNNLEKIIFHEKNYSTKNSKKSLSYNKVLLKTNKLKKNLISSSFWDNSQKMFFVSSSFFKSEKILRKNFNYKKLKFQSLLSFKQFQDLTNFSLKEKMNHLSLDNKKKENYQQKIDYENKTFKINRLNSKNKKFNRKKINPKFDQFILNSELKNKLLKNLRKNFLKKKFSSFIQKPKFHFVNLSRNEEFRKPLFAQPNKKNLFFTSFPYCKKSKFENFKKEKDLSKKESNKKTKERKISFYLKNFNMNFKPGWVYVFTLKKNEKSNSWFENFKNFHQLFLNSGKMICSDFNFEQNSIYIENSSSKLSKKFDTNLTNDSSPGYSYWIRNKNIFLKNLKFFQNKNARYIVNHNPHNFTLLIRPIYAKILPNNYDLKMSFCEISKSSDRIQKYSREFLKDYHSNLLNKQFIEKNSFVSGFPTFDFSIERISPTKNIQNKYLWSDFEKIENKTKFDSSLINKFEKTSLNSQKKFSHRKKINQNSKIGTSYPGNILKMRKGNQNFGPKEKKLLKNIVQKYLLLKRFCKIKPKIPNHFFKDSRQRSIKEFIQKSILTNFHSYYSYNKIFYHSFQSNWQNPNFNNSFSNFSTPMIQINSKISNLKSKKLNKHQCEYFKSKNSVNSKLKNKNLKSFKRLELSKSLWQNTNNNNDNNKFLHSKYLKGVKNRKKSLRNTEFYQRKKKNSKFVGIQNVYSLPYFKWFFVTKTAYLGNQRIFSHLNLSQPFNEKQIKLGKLSPFYKNSFLFYKSNFTLKNSKIANTDIYSPFQGELVSSNFQKNSWWNNFSEHFLIEKQKKNNYQIILTKKDIFSIFFPKMETFEKFAPLKPISFYIKSFINLKTFGKENFKFMNLKTDFSKQTFDLSNKYDFTKKISKRKIFYDRKKLQAQFDLTISSIDNKGKIQPKILEFHKNGEKIKDSNFVIKKQNLFYNSLHNNKILFSLDKIPEKQKNYISYLKNLYYKNVYFLQNFEQRSTSFFDKENYEVKDFLAKYQKRFYKLKGLDIGKPNKLTKIRLGYFLFKGDFIHSLRSFHKTGQILHFNLNKITFRNAQPFLVSAKGILHVQQGDPIFQNLPIITLPFDTFTTGDIVQGIPKVEQYLEARTTQNGRLFLYSLPVLLQGIFRRYYTKFPLDQAVSQTFLKIQLIIVDGVQRVYRSQGVSISDKHLEVIVKQMTSKVRILQGGQTGFFAGELVELEIIERINPFLMVKIQYEPVVLGITRASLEVESFLSAASFQQTTKILAKASLYKKKDFLKGLKENILIGNLVPAGTGYMNRF